MVQSKTNGATVSKITKPAFGTKEWAVKNVNCISGCENDCKYCYAKSMAIRFNRKTSETWKIEEVNSSKLPKNFKKIDGRIMFPSSHDITPQSLDICLETLRKLLIAGNEVLIVTKPRLEVVKSLSHELECFKEQIMFRFTIGSSDSDILKFWEPNAPSFEERLASLMYANIIGFKTSLSIEPCLDLNPEYVIDRCTNYITGDIWVGLPNMLRQRLSSNGGNDYDTQCKANQLMAGQSIEWVNKLVNQYKDCSKIKWKDSIQKVIKSQA
ncbi:radical SAM family protein [Mangrovibacterium lignilyticum]|uniref:radical SAM protein n=1 Tax=Mangrovibacterium lignilyticum TaxID=2668052 RepID=UPI0013CF9B3C|nr:radical SAM protein [Mangrovibacterium lignilyticum]